MKYKTDIRLLLWKNGIPAFVALAGLGVWEFSARRGLISKVFFPAPSDILVYALRSLASGELLTALGATLGRLTSGFLLGALPGLILGWAMGQSQRLRFVIDPFIAALYALPKIAIFPLFMIIFGLGETSKVVTVAVSAFFPLLINTIVGIRQINPVYIEVAQNYGADRWATLTRVIFPGSLPIVLAGVRIALNTALVIVIAVELLGANTGLGVMIWYAWQTFRIAGLYVALFVIALMGITINVCLQWISRWLAPWHSHANPEEGL